MGHYYSEMFPNGNNYNPFSESAIEARKKDEEKSIEQKDIKSVWKVLLI